MSGPQHQPDPTDPTVPRPSWEVPPGSHPGSGGPPYRGSYPPYGPPVSPPPYATGGYGAPGYGAPGYGAPGLPPRVYGSPGSSGVPPRRHRRWPLITAFVVLLAAAAAVAVVFVTRSPHPAGGAAGRPGSSTSMPASPGASPTPTFDPTDLQQVLNAESTALLKGDQTGWLAPVDPAATSVVTEYKRIYRNLRAMHVTVFGQINESEPGSVSAKPGSYVIQAEYCLVAPSCTATNAGWNIDVKLEAGKATIVGYHAAQETAVIAYPLPWQVADLTVAVGPRVVVAASGNEARQVMKTLPIVEKAASVDDQFALWGTPAVYIVYLADRSEFGTWFDSKASYTHVIGYTDPLSPTDLEVAVVFPDAARDSGPGGLADTVQHEMAHVATLQNRSTERPNNSFEEGIADYAAALGHSSWESDRLDATRTYIQRGKWSHQLYLESEIKSTNVLTANAAYGIGYLALRYLASAYGQDKMLQFFGDLEHRDESLDDASQDAFGKPWKTVNAAGVSYVERTLGV